MYERKNIISIILLENRTNLLYAYDGDQVYHNC